MNTRLCESLHDYVAGELNEDHSAEFESHMLSCEDCRRNVQLDNEIDRLLLAAHQATTAEGQNGALVELADRRLGTEIVRSRVLATLWVLVPSLLFMTILWRAAPVPDENAARPTDKIAKRGPPKDSKEKTVSQRLTISTEVVPDVTSDTHLAVEIKTSDPEVKLLWFYPTDTTNEEPKK